MAVAVAGATEFPDSGTLRATGAATAVPIRWFPFAFGARGGLGANVLFHRKTLTHAAIQTERGSA